MTDINNLIMSNALSVQGEAPDAPETVDEWGVFNDPDFWGPKFASGEMHEELREVVLERPLFVSETAGEAKRYQQFFTLQRTEHGQLDFAGPLVLRTQRVVRHPWRTVTGAEWDEIDDGRRPSGR